MSQEEQNAKEKTIMDLQQYVMQRKYLEIYHPIMLYILFYRALKIAQAKVKQAQTQQQQDVSEILDTNNYHIDVLFTTREFSLITLSRSKDYRIL